MAIDPVNLARWRLILGKSAEDALQQIGNCVGQPILGGDQRELDETLEAVYGGDEIERSEWESPTDGRRHGAVKVAHFRAWRSGWTRSVRSFRRTSWSCCRKMRSSGAG